MDSDEFRSLTSSDYRMNTFVYDTVDSIRRLQLDGLELAWEYPRWVGAAWEYPAGGWERPGSILHVGGSGYFRTLGGRSPKYCLVCSELNSSEDSILAHLERFGLNMPAPDRGCLNTTLVVLPIVQKLRYLGTYWVIGSIWCITER